MRAVTRGWVTGLVAVVLVATGCGTEQGTGMLALNITADIPAGTASSVVLTLPGTKDRSYLGAFPPAGGGALVLEYPGLPASDLPVTMTVRAFDASNCLVANASKQLTIKGGVKTTVDILLAKSTAACADGGGSTTTSDGGSVALDGLGAGSDGAPPPVDGTSNTETEVGAVAADGAMADAPATDVAKDLPPPISPETGIADGPDAINPVRAEVADTPLTSETGTDVPLGSGGAAGTGGISSSGGTGGGGRGGINGTGGANGTGGVIGTGGALGNGGVTGTGGGGGATTPGHPKGAACSIDSECASGHCADSVCCDTVCDGTCQYCKLTGAPGTCTVLAAGASPQPGHGACSVPGTACGSSCNGSSPNCSYASTDGQQCGTASCPDSTHYEPVGTCSTGSCTTQILSCSTNQTCLGGKCFLTDGQTCASDLECYTGSCTTFYPDTDSDAHGDQNATLANGLALRQCGTTKQGYVTTNDDCCDRDANAHPGQTAYFKTARTGCGGFDYNCISGEEKDPATSVGKLPGTCGSPSCALSGGNCVYASGCGCTGSDPCASLSVAACGQSQTYSTLLCSNTGTPTTCVNTSSVISNYVIQGCH